MCYVVWPPACQLFFLSLLLIRVIVIFCSSHSMFVWPTALSGGNQSMCKEIVIHALKLEEKKNGKKTTSRHYKRFVVRFYYKFRSFILLFVAMVFLFFFESFYLLLTVCNVSNYYRAYWCVYTVYDVKLFKLCFRTFANLLYLPLDSSSSASMLQTELKIREPQNTKYLLFTFLGCRE